MIAFVQVFQLKISTHEKSKLHGAVVGTFAATNAGVSVAASISAGKHKQVLDARTAMLAILSSVRYRSCQGLAIQGSTNEEPSMTQLLPSCTQILLHSWLTVKENVFLAEHEILNVMTEMMADDVLRALKKSNLLFFFL